PDWAFEAIGQETRGTRQDVVAYHPGLYLSTKNSMQFVVTVRLENFIQRNLPSLLESIPNQNGLHLKVSKYTE
ncbi:unnamed protein product, partial [Sphenostylis stenocarpa]